MNTITDYIDGMQIQCILDENKKAWFLAEHIKGLMRTGIEDTDWYAKDTIINGSTVMISTDTVKNIKDKFMASDTFSKIENLVTRIINITEDRTPVTMPQFKTDFSFQEGDFEYDFNSGARIKLLKTGNYIVNFIDMNTGYSFNNSVSVKDTPVEVDAPIKYFVQWRIEVLNQKGELLLEKELRLDSNELQDKTFAVAIATVAIGDTLAWLVSGINFLLGIHCGRKVIVSPCVALNDLIFKNIPEGIEVVNSINDLPEDTFATYYIGAFMSQHPRAQLTPINPRQVGLLDIPRHVFTFENLPSSAFPIEINAHRKIKEPYVCISTHGSSAGKNWNYPDGWHYLVKWLREQGYRVLHIDLESTIVQGDYVLTQPNGVEDLTGGIPLEKRAEQLYYADFFVGVSSGLSWLANSVGTPTVLISGITQPFNEFYTPYRIINYCACHGCYNDCSIDYNKFRFDWCPRHQYDIKKFECTKTILPQQVIGTCAKLMQDFGLDPKNGIIRRTEE